MFSSSSAMIYEDVILKKIMCSKKLSTISNLEVMCYGAKTVNPGSQNRATGTFVWTWLVGSKLYTGPLCFIRSTEQQ